MRTRYHPDGSVDYEADRMLEILRHADEELAQQQRDQAQRLAGAQSHESAPASKELASVSNDPTAPPTIMDFVNDPIADLIGTTALMPPNPLTSLPNTTTSKP